MSKELIESAFPHITNSGYSIDSPETVEYNCVAWAAADSETLWWPDHQNICYWPPGAPREATKDAFVKAFETLDYRCCENDFNEEGYEKIAIYVDPAGKPTHVARQLSTGRWTSKLGQKEDVEHALDAFKDSIYGDVYVIMKRSIKTH